MELPERRPARFRQQPVQRAAADLRPARAADVLGSEGRTRAAHGRGASAARSATTWRVPTRSSRIPGRDRSASSGSSATTMAVEADYVYWASALQHQRRQHQPVVQPRNGTAVSDHQRQPAAVPRVGHRQHADDTAWATTQKNHSVQVGLTKRFSNRWQASATLLAGAGLRTRTTRRCCRTWLAFPQTAADARTR